MTADGAAAVMFNPFEEGFFEDPYPQYARLRALDPVHRSPLGGWMLFRHADVVGLLRRPDLSVDPRSIDPGLLPARFEITGEPLEPTNILSMDPPDHTRLRRMVTRAFTPRTVEQLEGRVTELVDGILASAGDAGGMDLIGTLAFPLPFTVISEMLGMPTDGADELREWSSVLVRTLDPTVTPDEVAEAERVGTLMEDRIRSVIAHKRRHPDDRLLSALIAINEDGDTLSDTELVSQVMLLYIAGHETTVNLIGNGTLALLRHPDQLERLRSDPSLDANAVEELLRYDSPVQLTRRITTGPLRIGDVDIPPGAPVFCVLGSANRDPEAFGPDADDLDISRPTANQHTSFGGGIHYCLGNALARMEARVALGRLVRTFDRIELAGEPPWNGRIVLRGLTELPLSLT